MYCNESGIISGIEVSGLFSQDIASNELGKQTIEVS